MAEIKSRRAPQMEAEIRVPGDKSISHRAVLLSAMARGTSVITGFLPGEDCMCTVNAMRALGVKIEQPEPSTLIVEGCGGEFQAPANDIDCGNSGTLMRLLTGFLAGQPFSSRLVGDASLSSRPMDRVIGPLSKMGACITGQGERGTAPLNIEGTKLKGIHYQSPVASAQIKSSVLLAGLFAEGSTSVSEPVQSRDHSERMFEFYGLHPQKSGLTVSVQGGQIPQAKNFQIPGDISSAAFWLVAAAAQPGSHLLVKEVGLNLTRTGILSVLVRMGTRHRENVEKLSQGEQMGSLEVWGGPFHGTTIEGREIPNVIDELPVLAVAGALAKGTTIIRDAKELRVKETDRITAVVTNLKLMGAQVEETPDGMIIQGGVPLKGATLPSYGDHRIAMAFAIAGLFAEGETTITDTGCVATSYPGFEKTLQEILRGGAKPAPVFSRLV
ncbi:MAG TPA: 3-phosphoshikimate 1-carboxyvinyltransferase, partial [Chthoniobacterales bacterium]